MEVKLTVIKGSSFQVFDRWMLNRGWPLNNTGPLNAGLTVWLNPHPYVLQNSLVDHYKAGTDTEKLVKVASFK